LSKLTVPFVDLRAQHAALADDISQALMAVVHRADFIKGAAVTNFEKAFAEFLGARHVIGVSSGLDALRLALHAAGVGPDDEVIVPANTFIATALAVSAVGARPVLVDCKPTTYNIDTSAVERAITARTRAIMPVHLAGQSADLDPLLALAERHGLKIVEDAAQAHGTRYKGTTVGTIGSAGCFSFYPAKNLGALGDGGAIATNDDGIAERARRFGDYGARTKYEHVEKGINARLDTLHAAVLTVKLGHLARWNQLRDAHAQRYDEALGSIPEVQAPLRSAFSTHIYHLYMIRVQDRDGLRGHLERKGISTGIHYPTPIHLQPAYKDLGYHAGDFPVSEELSRTLLSLPMYPELCDEQIDYVADGVRSYYA
jgi:dTDP-4-amino-4,6-dideoxygalactose transaminase